MKNTNTLKVFDRRSPECSNNHAFCCDEKMDGESVYLFITVII